MRSLTERPRPYANYASQHETHVCVPGWWSNEQIKSLAKSENPHPSGDEWQIRDRYTLTEPEGWFCVTLVSGDTL